MVSQPICAACGLPLKRTSKEDIKEVLLCSGCTLNGTVEPSFEVIVYKAAITYAKSEKEQIWDEKELLEYARHTIMQLPYWQNKKLPTPTLEGLKNAKQLKYLFTKIDTLEISESIFEPRDFFISHKWHEKCDKDIVEPLIKALKTRGYRIWYDKDVWGTEVGEKESWMKHGVEQSRHSVAILCKDYFTSKACRYELETILNMKDKKFVHLIWWSDINEEFLTQDELGKQTLRLEPIIWEKTNIINLITQLINLANKAEGPQKYNDVELIADEARMMNNIENLLNEQIPFLEKNAVERYIPARFGFYAEEQQIIALMLHEKGLKSLPSNLGQAQRLRTLDLSYNDLRMLPTSLTQLKHLENLNIVGNPLQNLPPSLRTVHNHFLPQYPNVAESEAEFLALLELVVGQRLSEVKDLEDKPYFFGYILEDNHVKALGIVKFSKELNFIPKNIENLNNLQRIDVRWNIFMTSLPETFGNLQNLQWIDLSHNGLVVLPKTIGNLVNLRTLNLEGNKLISLPESIGNFTNLQSLNLELNHLSFLPESLGHLRSLQYLSLKYNELKTIPESIGNLQSLHTLELSSNQLTELPESFIQLSNLTTLIVDKNLLKNPTIQKLQQNRINGKKTLEIRCY